jgi:hypothetical protein
LDDGFIRRADASAGHAHEHEHDGDRHLHFHTHHHGHSLKNILPHKHTHAAFGIGTLHGLAGSSHFLGVLPALAFPTTVQAIAYIAAFGVGTVAAMALFSWDMGRMAARFAGRGQMIYRGLMTTCAWPRWVWAFSGWRRASAEREIFLPRLPRHRHFLTWQQRAIPTSTIPFINRRIPFSPRTAKSA